MDAHTSLTARGADLLDAARAATSKRAAATIFNSPILKAVLLGLAEGGALAEHNGPPFSPEFVQRYRDAQVARNHADPIRRRSLQLVGHDAQRLFP